jgi:hypothetical protein
MGLHVPALAPRIYFSEAALQFTENTKFILLCRVNTGTVREQSKISCSCRGGIVYVWTVKYWARTKPWGTPIAIAMATGVANSPATMTSNFLSLRKKAISLTRLVENSHSDNLCSRPQCHVVSKAFSISKNTAAVDILLLKFGVTWSTSLIYWSVLLWTARKSNWLTFSKILSSACFGLFLKSASQIIFA